MGVQLATNWHDNPEKLEALRACIDAKLRAGGCGVDDSTYLLVLFKEITEHQQLLAQKQTSE